jgi:hypothetical protein
MVTTSAQSAQRRLRGIHEECGLAEHAGPCFTSAASRNGPPTKAPLLLANRRKMAKCHLQGSGAVQVATFPRMFYQRISTVGARRSLIPSLCQDYRHSRAVRLVLALESYQRAVPTHALSPATLVLVHLVV